MANELRRLMFTSVCLFFLMLTGISRTRVVMMMQRATPVTVGETAPDFTLEDQSRRKVTLSESRGRAR